MPSTFSWESLGVMRLTKGTITRPASIVIAPALMGDAMNLNSMFATVKPTPKMKHTHTESFVVFFQ